MSKGNLTKCPVLRIDFETSLTLLIFPRIIPNL